MLSTLECDNVVKIVRYEKIAINGAEFPLVAYEFVDGGDLCCVVADDHAPLSIAEILEIGECVACGIEALWSKRVVHRDIKPDNIIKGADGRIVLVDLGVARHLDLATATATGMTLGTRGYMSPEQARGRRALTIRSDVFSLGVTLYEVATKKHPFNRTQNLIGSATPRAIQEWRADLPAALAQLIHQMMHTTPALRPRAISDRFRRLREEA